MKRGNIVYEDAYDQHIRAINIYAKSNSDGYAYADKECTKKIEAKELENMFNMNEIQINDGTSSYKAIALSVSENVATITYVKADTSTATTAVLATLRSE